MPLRHGSTGTSTHGPGSLPGNGQPNPEKAVRAVGAQELVADHVRFQSRNAPSSPLSVSCGTSSGSTLPTVSIAARICPR